MVPRLRLFLAFAALAGFAGVALDALGAHALGPSPDPARLRLLDLATRYLLIHALALIGVVALCARTQQPPPARWLTASAWAFAAGMVLFCGGLAVHALTGVAMLGPLVPVGGSALLLGWLTLLVHALRSRA